jgi:AcrR family transcriptional regulator
LMPETGNAASKPKVTAVRENEREALTHAMLELSGERGYRQATLKRLLAISGVEPSQFYRHFRNRGECFAAAYELEAERLCGSLLGACARESSLRDGVHTAILELLRFAVDRPNTVRAILCEVQVAGGVALSKHDELLDRLSHALSSASGEPQDPPQSPHTATPTPPRAAEFIVGAIEGVVKSCLSEPRNLSAVVPELMHIALGPYLGEDVARAELSRQPPPV